MSAELPVQVAPARHVTIALAAVVTGLTEKAIRQKIAEGVWIEGREYTRHVVDGRIYIDLRGYEKWVEQARVLNYARSPSASGSNGKVRGAEKH